MSQKLGWTSGLCLGAILGVLAAAPTATAMQAEGTSEQPAEKKLREAAEALASQWAHDDEVQRWTDAVEADPQDPQANFMLAYAVHSAGDLDRAIELHKKAMRFPQVRANALYNLGCAYALKGEVDEAFIALDRCVNLGVRDAEQFEGDTDLTGLHPDVRWGELISKAETFSTSPPERALHFWAGQWDCYGAGSGILNGTNTLELRVKKNVLHEQWTDSQGGTGESWNYYNAAKGTWRQIWMDDNGIGLEMDANVTGERPDGGVLFEGAQIRKDGTTVTVRMHVRPVGDGWVRQTGTDTRDGGQTWNPRYDLVYVPKGTDFDPAMLAEESDDEEI